MVPFLCRVAVGVIVFFGATMGLYSLFVRQASRRPLSLPASEALSQRPFLPPSIIPVIAVTLLFSVVAATSSRTAHAPPPATAMLSGAVLYSLTLLITVLGCMSYSKIGFREAFGLTACRWPVALAKGLRYGIEILPLILVLTMAVTSIGEALGFDMKPQKIFDCLEDQDVSIWVKTALIVCAVGVAPVVEELLFRGVLLPLTLKGRTFLFGALLTSLYFSLIHLHATSFLPLLVLSIGFSAGYAATGSILTPIAMHAVFNFTGLLLFFAELK
jgi:membrane protease YdiL (CAAX protease family)